VVPTVHVPANITVPIILGQTSVTAPFAISGTGACGPVTPVARIGSTVITSPHAFPAGVTTVTVSVTDISGLVATASFTVTAVTDVCIQDDHSGDTLTYVVQTGSYTYTRCKDGFTLSGAGVVSVVNGMINLTDSGSDRKITAGFNTGQLTGREPILL
jgi:hypothetical protein